MAGGNGTQNTTAPEDDFGFGNVGQIFSPTDGFLQSCVYLGGNWILAAYHSIRNPAADGFALGQVGDAVEQVPTLLAGVVSGFHEFIASLPGSVNADQLTAAIGQIEAILPSTESIEVAIETALGLDDPEFEFEFEDADGDLNTPGLLAIARLKLDDLVKVSKSLPLDFDLDIGGQLMDCIAGKLGTK